MTIALENIEASKAKYDTSLGKIDVSIDGLRRAIGWLEQKYNCMIKSFIVDCLFI